MTSARPAFAPCTQRHVPRKLRIPLEPCESITSTLTKSNGARIPAAFVSASRPRSRRCLKMERSRCSRCANPSIIYSHADFDPQARFAHSPERLPRIAPRTHQPHTAQPARLLRIPPGGPAHRKPFAWIDDDRPGDIAALPCKHRESVIRVVGGRGRAGLSSAPERTAPFDISRKQRPCFIPGIEAFELFSVGDRRLQAALVMKCRAETGQARDDGR